MAFIYVKSGGTATGTAGKYTTAKTGSWSTAFTDPSQYYGSLKYCITNASLSEGDTIYLSDLHNYTNAIGNTSFSLEVTNVLNLRIISLDDDDLSVPNPGAKEIVTFTSGYNSFFITFPYVYGVIFECTTMNAYFRVPGSSALGTYKFFEKCSFIYENSYFWYMSGSAKFVECLFQTLNTTVVTDYKIYIFQNCSFISSTSTSSFFNSYSNNTCNYIFDGCDFSQANRPFLPNYVNDYNYEANQRFVIFRSLESANNRYRDYPMFWGVEEDPSGFYLSGSDKNSISVKNLGITYDSTSLVYRTDGATSNGVDYYSFKTIALNYANLITCPTVFKLAEFFSMAAEGTTFTVEIAQDDGATPLTDYEIYMDVYYMSLTKSKSIRESTIKILPSSTSLPTSSKTWVGLTNPTKQYLSITLSELGTFGLNSVYLGIRAVNKTFYVCPKVDIS